MFDPEDYRDPFEDFDWRWRRIRSLVDEEQCPQRNLDDRFIFRGHRFLRELQATTSESDRYRLARRFPNVSKAFSLFMDKGQRKQFTEALSLCTDLTLEEEAHYFKVPDLRVLMYEKLFFDVRDHVGYTGYLITKILQPAVI